MKNDKGAEIVDASIRQPPSADGAADALLGRLHDQLNRASAEILALRGSRAYKFTRYLGALRRDLPGTTVVSLRWLTGGYRRQGVGLIGALKASDPLGRAQELVQEASGLAGRSVLAARSLEAPEVRGCALDLVPGVPGRVSVVLPVYNHADMLDEAIRSVLGQTYENLELIVVNDGSTDGVERILDRYVDDLRVIVLTQPNQKLPEALNQGFAYATGQYYTWTSADNVMLANQLEVLVGHLQQHPEHAMVFSDYQAIDEAGKPLRDPSFRPQNQDPSDPSFMRLPTEVTEGNFHDSGDNFLGASFLYRRAAARLVGRYTNDTFGGEDYDYWLRLHTLFDIGHRGEVLYLYRVHDNTLNAKAKELKLFENISRLRERDRARRAAMRQTLRFEQVGTTFPLPSGSGEEAALLFSYASRRAPQALSVHAQSRRLVVCWVEGAAEDVDPRDLSACDLVLCATREGFERLEPVLGDRVLWLDVAAHTPFFEKVARYRAFEKQFLGAPRASAKPYLGRKLHVAFQVDSLDRGGLEQVVANLVRSVSRERFEVSVIINGKERGLLGSALEKEGIPVYLTDGDAQARARIVAEHKIDLVNLHYSVAGIEDYERAGVPVVYTVHNSYTWLNRTEVEARRRAFGKIGRFIAVSSRVADYVGARFKVPAAQLEVIPNGLAPEHFAEPASVQRAELGLADDDVVFVNVASVNTYKGHHLMLSALRKLASSHPKLKLLFVGDVQNEALAESLHKRVRSEGLTERVRFLGYQPKERIAGILALSDCFLLPSIHEGWSNAVMEALFYGLPVILTDTGSARELVLEQDVGIVIPPAYERLDTLTPEEVIRLAYEEAPANLGRLEEAISTIYAAPAEWKRKAQAGRRKVTEQYTFEYQIRRYEEAFLHAYGVDRKRVRSSSRAGAAVVNASVERSWPGKLAFNLQQLSSGQQTPGETLAKGLRAGEAVVHRWTHRLGQTRMGAVSARWRAHRRDQAQRKDLGRILAQHDGKRILVFPPLLDWDVPLYQRPQHIAANLARQGYLYFFCSPAGQYDRGLDGFEEISDGCYKTNRFDLLVELDKPKTYHLYSTDLNRDAPAFPRDCAFIERELSRGNSILYEYIDEIHPAISGTAIPEEVYRRHDKLLSDERISVVASANKLLDDVRRCRSKNYSLVTNGVEFEHFARTFDPGQVPAELKALVESGRPLIGYFGALAEWFDYELVIELAEARPDCDIVLVGLNYDGSLDRHGIAGRRRIHVLPPVPYKNLPRYAYWLDVLTIPFRINAITESTSPIKLFEYMALGKPIVTTAMPECRKYQSVMVGESHAHFIELIGAALEKRTDAKYIELLRAEGRANTWQEKARDIARLLETPDERLAEGELAYRRGAA